MIEITEVEITLAGDIEATNDRLLAYANIEISGCFVVHALRIVHARDRILVAMPSRKLMNKCHECAARNIVLADFCNKCGVWLNRSREFINVHTDVAHPITNEARHHIEDRVLEAYYDELALAARDDDTTPCVELARKAV